MGRFIPKPNDEFTWQCSLGHWNKSDELSCRTCREPKPERPEVLKDLLEQVHREHPRDNDH